MPVRTISTKEVIELRKVLSKGTVDRSVHLSALLGMPVRSPKALREWHDLLLFLLAYPGSAKEFRSVSLELQRISQVAKHMMQKSEGHRHALINSGLDGAPLQSTYSLRLVVWMLDRWKSSVQLFLTEAPLDELRELVRPILTAVERETVDQAFDDAQHLLDTVYGPSRSIQLQRLVDGLDRSSGDEFLRELLFERMRISVKVEVPAPGLGMTFSRGPMGPVYHHPHGLSRKVGPLTDRIAGGVKAVKLSAAEGSGLIDTARIVLATMHRETDPVTHAGAAELFDMGRGLRIGLFHLDAAHRLPFDSYVGFMAFKNGIPLAYGGAWIFPGRSKIGINVFPALRGGESAWFFAHLLRLYRQRFGVDRFEAENYQLGHNNPDGLKSGAYWFYYRSGFRPFTPAMRRTAAQEFERLGARTGHQVPVKLLRRMVEEGLELVIEERDVPIVDTAALTMAVQKHIVERYDGDRQLALGKALARVRAVLDIGDLGSWSTSELLALELWALPLDMITDLEQWPRTERDRLRALVRSKGQRTETLHQRQLAAAGRLLGSLRMAT